MRCDTRRVRVTTRRRDDARLDRTSRDSSVPNTYSIPIDIVRVRRVYFTACYALVRHQYTRRRRRGRRRRNLQSCRQSWTTPTTTRPTRSSDTDTMSNPTMDGESFRSTMSSLNYGTVMEAAARNYIKEKMEDEAERAGQRQHAVLDARDLAEVRTRVRTHVLIFVLSCSSLSLSSSSSSVCTKTRRRRRCI